MYGKGYDGVRRAPTAGVGGTLPRIVLADSVDSVDAVWAPVGNGLLKAASSEGDMEEDVSSLIGETLRAPRLPGLAAIPAPRSWTRWFTILSLALTSLLSFSSSSASSGKRGPSLFPCMTPLAALPSVAIPPLLLASLSVALSSVDKAGSEFGLSEDGVTAS